MRHISSRFFKIVTSRKLRNRCCPKFVASVIPCSKTLALNSPQDEVKVWTGKSEYYRKMIYDKQKDISRKIKLLVYNFEKLTPLKSFVPFSISFSSSKFFKKRTE